MHPMVRKLRHRLMQMLAPQRLTWEENFRPPWALRGQGRIDVGNRTYWFGDSVLSAWKQSDSIAIGAYCSIASGALVMAGGNHLVEAISTYPFTMIENWREWNAEPQPGQKVTIGNDVWIGSRAMVIGDVTVGDGAIVGAGAVVVRDVAPYSVVVGVPARVVRERFTAEEVAVLDRLAWWTWPEPDILDAEPILRAHDVASLAAFAAERGLTKQPATAAPALSATAEPVGLEVGA